jgi:phospholipid:diacylglycerol acyltransferase
MVFHFFMQWASHHKGPHFIEERIQFVYHVGGAFLGVPKAVAALMAGEMKDSDLGAFQPVLDSVMNADERAKLWRSWGSLYSMLPKGGSEIFNNMRFTINGERKSLEEIIEVMHTKIPGFKENMKLVEAGPEIKDTKEKETMICRDAEIGTSCFKRSWTSVLRSPLPKGKDLKIFCVYGKSILTESSYHFVEGPDGTLHIDLSVNDEAEETVRGIRRTDGDGSVSVESLAYACESAWQRDTLNPHGMKVKSRIIPHDKEPNIFSRVVLGYSGKVESSEHVDILGHHSVLEDVVALAAGHIELVND